MWAYSGAMDTRLKILRREVFFAGKVIFREGETGTLAYVIETVQVEIWREEGGERRRLGVIGEGGIFGEMALIDNEPRMASATALTETSCVVVPEDVFKSKVDAADPFVIALLRIFVANIRSITRHRRATDRPAGDPPAEADSAAQS